MRAPVSQRPLLAALALASIALGGCGKSGQQTHGGGPTPKLDPVAAQGAVSLATRNTTRLGGTDAVGDAAAVARAVYPGLTPTTRPTVVTLVDTNAWLPALAASVLASAPTRAPILYSEGNTLPALSAQTLQAMRPLGAPTLGGAQVIAIGSATPAPEGYRTHPLQTGEPAATASAIEQLLARLSGATPHQTIVLATNAPPTLAMPAAALAAESGAPILFVTPTHVPAATAAALSRMHKPSIYVIDSSSISRQALDQLHHYGPITSITDGGTSASGEAAVSNAIEVARFTSDDFGWGVKEPGHGLVFVNTTRPLDAPAAAPLSATGDYGPLLLLTSPNQVPPALATYLSDIQPAYTSAPQFQPVHGVYNHGWLIGDEQAITAATQAQIDTMLEISPRPQSAEEPAVSPIE